MGEEVLSKKKEGWEPGFARSAGGNTSRPQGTLKTENVTSRRK